VVGGAAGGLETGDDVSNTSFFTGKSGVLSKVFARLSRLGDVAFIFFQPKQL
jgi:hypothetical protein